VILAVLVIGLLRGRKRGMSEELLDMIKWGLIVCVAAWIYQPVGKYLSHTTMFSLLACYLAVYACAVLSIAAIFAMIRQQVGNKLLSSDAFGTGEYYLGMLAGVFRYACIILVIMAFLNARYYTPQEIRANEQFQDENFGSIRFPTLMDVQKEVLNDSFMGRMVRDYLPATLIKPTSPEDKGLAGDNNVFQRRQGSVNDVLEKR